MRQPACAGVARELLASISLTYAHCETRYCAKSCTDFASAACAPRRPVACSTSRARRAALASLEASSPLTLISSLARQRRTAAPSPDGRHSSSALANAGAAKSTVHASEQAPLRIDFMSRLPRPPPASSRDACPPPCDPRAHRGE